MDMQLEAWLRSQDHKTMSGVIPPSSSPFPVSSSSKQTDPPPAEREDEGPDHIPITSDGQICFERVIPSQDHYYKLPDPPVCTGKNGSHALFVPVGSLTREEHLKASLPMPRAFYPSFQMTNPYTSPKFLNKKKVLLNNVPGTHKSTRFEVELDDDGGGKTTPRDDLCPLPLNAVGFVDKLWRKNDLLVYFLTLRGDQDMIMSWANEWSKYCAIIFHQTLKQKSSDIRVAFNEGGSWSYTGTDALTIPKESFTMNLGTVDKPTVLHEFGHALGLIHEHQSPFKGGFKWNKEEVIKSLSGPPNYWDMERIENNMFKRYKRKDLDGTLYDPKSIMHYAFPRNWIIGDGYPEGIDRNTKLSPRDKEHVKRLYGPSRLSGNATEPRGSGRVSPSIPVAKRNERTKPVTSLPTPDGKSVHDIQVFEPHRGELSGMGAELLLRFHTSTKERPRYTIQTHGDCDMILALLGPDDYTKQIRVDDDSGDGQNAKISTQLLPDKDYYVQIQTFDSKGGKFEFSITSW